MKYYFRPCRDFDLVWINPTRNSLLIHPLLQVIISRKSDNRSTTRSWDIEQILDRRKPEKKKRLRVRVNECGEATALKEAFKQTLAGSVPRSGQFNLLVTMINPNTSYVHSTTRSRDIAPTRRLKKHKLILYPFIVTLNVAKLLQVQVYNQLLFKLIC